MNSCALSPPNSSRLSDTVIGAVMQRPTWKPRGNSSDCVDNVPDNERNAANSYEQQSRRHTYRYAPYQERDEDYPSKGPTKMPAKTSKNTVLSSSIAELIGQTDLPSGRRRISCLSSDLNTVKSIIANIQGGDHHITAELQQAIVAEALKKKIRHRERSRLYRQKLTRVETDVNDAITKLISEIKNLEAKGNDAVRLPTKLTSWALASEYFRQFNYYLSSPRTLYKMASTFLHEIMAPDVTDGSLFGVDAQLEGWRLLALYFGDVRVDLKGLRTPTHDTLIAGTVTSVTITNNTLRRAFPHLNSDGVGGTEGGAWSPLAAKVLGKRLVMHGSVFFCWDCATDKVVSLHSQADMITPMLNLLGSLEDVSCAFFKARVTPDCKFVRGE
ncbi:hypothetical protein PC129_g22979 [Phytophthora cactorum]|uniref:BZIP transcription factor 1 n=2 Tax=Phytophthora cactorum TaxID=29920 RepID=A0A8T1F625_9STRA|nr:hypothetical protein Pcac1_g4175 [Phytophthora cactorum]KAG2963304.1 hypothetical protein PC118_g20968 [Phytophthora cactorum]KAG2988591.1 hypothetical protein PC119_g19492 [Phytophthora cactorum]KAG3151227.1 hypothetical protein C6341_g16607 [Phytophthora cactorum]KAG3203217.1 hypothetical protein PC129_g22979 [Phytophthora cactorum]